jgi:ABC-2 type transport system ATP-binding protein
VIEAEGLSKRYGRIRALNGLSFVARPGEVLALLGPNGAGKSTTIKAVTGLIRPTSGRVRVAGFDIAKQTKEAKLRFGYVPDRPYLYGKLTARELLRFVGELRKTPGHAHKAQAWLEFFGLQAFANELIESFSHGMRQKLTFITALLHEPEVLIVDEPMVGLDPRAAKQVRALLADYAAKGRTVLLTTHSMEVAQAIAHRVMVVNRGRLIAEGDLAALKRQAGLEGAHAQDGDLEAVFLRLTEEADPPLVGAGGPP